jgi:hypothetical protein
LASSETARRRDKDKAAALAVHDADFFVENAHKRGTTIPDHTPPGIGIA